jgi:cytochrome c oxidase accessory protein FixG
MADNSDHDDVVHDETYLQDKQVGAPSTIGEDGKRKWLYPDRRLGPRASKRKLAARALIFFYFLAPWLSIAGRPFVRVDVLNQSASILGLYLPMSEYNYIFFLLAPLALSLFLVTAIRGRIWCGYACPQTVFVDWVIRPLEELIEGPALQRRKNDEAPMSLKKGLKKVLKHGLFLVVSILVANAFLGFFIDPHLVLKWMVSPPSQHPTAFAFVVGITLLMYFDLAWFREQFCSFLCPYARFQSVMLDNDTPSVTYDPKRGEPRGKGKDKGDCINCGLCVRVCPTGIDIRHGLQLECIQCERCIDACDSIMTNIKRPIGLIDIKSQNTLNSGVKLPFYKRGRIVVYTVAIILVLALGALTINDRETVSLTILRQRGTAYSKLDDGRISNIFNIRATNHSDHKIAFQIKLVEPIDGVSILCPRCGLKLEPYKEEQLPLLIIFKAGSNLKKVKVKFVGGNEVHSLPIIMP